MMSYGKLSYFCYLPETRVKHDIGPVDIALSWKCDKCHAELAHQ